MPPEQTVPPLLQFPIIPYVFIILIFYFLIFKPQRAQKKKRQEMLANLKKNDQVVTSGGIHATIVNIKDRTVVVRIDDNSRMEVDKEAIASVEKSAD